MKRYRTKANPQDLHKIPKEITHNGMIRFIPEEADLEPEYRVAVGQYLDIPPEYDSATHQLGEVATWDEEAGTVTMDVVATPAKTQAEIFAQAQVELTETIQDHLDAVARTRNYDGILSLCSYAMDANPLFASEGQAGMTWRSACWRKGYEIMVAVVEGAWRERTQAEIDAGFFPVPTMDEVLAALPEISFPSPEEVQMIAAAVDGVSAEEDEAYAGNPLWATIKSWFGFGG